MVRKPGNHDFPGVNGAQGARKRRSVLEVTSRTEPDS